MDDVPDKSTAGGCTDDELLNGVMCYKLSNGLDHVRVLQHYILALHILSCAEAAKGKKQFFSHGCYCIFLICIFKLISLQFEITIHTYIYKGLFILWA